MTFINLSIFWIILFYRQFGSEASNWISLCDNNEFNLSGDSWFYNYCFCEGSVNFDCQDIIEQNYTTYCGLQSSFLSKSSSTLPLFDINITSQIASTQLFTYTDDFDDNIDTRLELCLNNTLCLTGNSSCYICLYPRSKLISAYVQKYTSDNENIYSEFKHSSLSSKRRVNKLFAYISLSIIILFSTTIILMDVFKRRLRIAHREKLRRHKLQINYSKDPKLQIVRRFIYSRTPKLQTIPEE